MRMDTHHGGRVNFANTLNAIFTIAPSFLLI